MGPSVVSDNLLTQLSEFVAERLGLHFPPNRWADLQRGLTGVMDELGFTDLATCAEWLLSTRLTKTQFDVLTSHLTIGETYFFRGKKTFEALAESVLPELVQSRRKGAKRLRIWSAACCTGEEAYSLAILLHQVIPDLADWFVRILATDINTRFLQKAAAGVYGEWSFRETPDSFKDRYFTRTDDGCYAILPEIKKRVTFAQLNLVEDAFPSLVTDTNAMDLIFGRNVLMYFSAPQAEKVVHNLRRALVPDGWLVVSPSEASQTLFSEFATVNAPGVVLYQRRDPAGGNEQSCLRSAFGDDPYIVTSAFEEPWPDVSQSVSVSSEPEFQPSPGQPSKENREHSSIADSLYGHGRVPDVGDAVLSSDETYATLDQRTFSLLTRALADQGKLTDALTCCDRWVASDKLDSSAHYLRAIVLQELGDGEQARHSLQRALYLDPQFVLAHFALGNLARGCGKTAEANKHFANALRLLGDAQPDEVIPESDGLTAGRLHEIIGSLIVMEAVP